MSNRVQAILSHVDGPTVLDLGCVQHDSKNASNDDWLHGELVNRFDRVVGVDYLEDDVADLDDRGYEVYHANVEAMTLPVTADTVVAGELIEHVANPGQMLARIQEHIKPQGTLVMSTPNPWLLARLRRLLQGISYINNEHVAWYGPQTLRQLLHRYDFTIDALYSTGPEHRGLTRVAQLLDSDIFGGTTWIVNATYEP